MFTCLKAKMPQKVYSCNKCEKPIAGVSLQIHTHSQPPSENPKREKITDRKNFWQKIQNRREKKKTGVADAADMSV